jgi:hypothetical protein
LGDAGEGDAATDVVDDSDAEDDGLTDGSSDSSLPDAGLDAEGSADVVADAADGSAGDAEVSPDIDPPAPVCGPAVDAWTGVLVEDEDGGTLDVGDVVQISVELLRSDSGAEALWVGLEHSQLVADPASAQWNGDAIVPTVAGDRWTIERADGAAGVLRYTATVESDEGLLSVFASVSQDPRGCEVPRGRSGAFFQITGGESKTPVCIDMARYRSMQVAPFVAKQNTAAYAAANGIREDLRAEGFIFCPQSPTIVHEAEFCLQRAPGQEVRFSGSYASDARWEVDDFILVEVDDGTEVVDAFTTQTHTGHPNRFYCNETRTQLCTTDCTAQLVEVDGGRRVPVLANVTAEGPTARQHVDGAVRITSLLPATGAASTVRITALDTGVEGTLSPALYLVGDPL